jgi:hypothetical protein
VQGRRTKFLKAPWALQRMQLHFRGIQVPALGSLRDIAYRQYLIHEAKLEAKKHQMMLMLTIGAPMITEDSQRSSWEKQAKTVFEEYVCMMFGEEMVSGNKIETDMLAFYEERIRTSRPIMYGNSAKNNLSVTGLPSL